MTISYAGLMTLALAYLIGAIPFSYLITRMKTGTDIRMMGSGNVGATNVMRTAGKAAGLIALLLDVLKGAAAVWLGKKVGLAPVAGFLAAVGHSYPVFLQFRGGKSVATGGGAFFLLAPVAMLMSMSVFAVLLVMFRFVALGSIFAAASFPLFAWLYKSDKDVIIWGSLSAILIVVRHRSNIRRMLQGTERKIGERKSA